MHRILRPAIRMMLGKRQLFRRTVQAISAQQLLSPLGYRQYVHGLVMRHPDGPQALMALGALIRKLRREQRLTLNQLAERVPMSASNLSRIELGAQGPPADEIIERIGQALDTDPAELLRAAGRYATGKTFEETVLARLDALGRDMREVKAAVTGRKPG